MCLLLVVVARRQTLVIRVSYLLPAGWDNSGQSAGERNGLTPGSGGHSRGGGE